MGLVVGICIFNFTEDTLKDQFIGEVKSTLELAKDENFEGINIIFNGLLLNFFIVLIIYFSSLTLIPNILIDFITFIKGIMVGIFIPIIFIIFGNGKGILAILLYNIIPNIIYLIPYLYLCNNSLLFHNSLINVGVKISIILSEIVKIIISFSFILISILIEQLASCILIHMYLGC
jgi:hypothetical protein